VHEEVQPAEVSLDRFEHSGDLNVVGDIAREQQRILQRRRKVPYVLFQPFALIRDGEPCACSRSGLRDCPRDRTLVCNADDESGLAGELHAEGVRERSRNQRERLRPPPPPPPGPRRWP
jgi:hypothetical protein